jgi:hypothetical protein
VPCWLSSYVCSTTYSTPSTSFLCLPISSTINYVSCCETFCNYSSTFAFKVFYPPPFKFCDFSSCCSYVVTTLTLGSWPKQGLTKVRAKSEARESHFMLSGMHECVKEWTTTLSSEFPFWELESQGTSKSS